MCHLKVGEHGALVLIPVFFFKQLIVSYKDWEHNPESISGPIIIFEVSAPRALEE